LAEGLLTEAQVKEIDQSVTEEVEDAVKFADESPKPVRQRSAARGELVGSWMCEHFGKWTCRHA